MDSDCKTGVCDGGLLYGLFKGKCFTPQKAGEKCDADEQCISGDCDGHAFGLFFGKCDSKAKIEETDNLMPQGKGSAVDFLCVIACK